MIKRTHILGFIIVVGIICCHVALATPSNITAKASLNDTELLMGKTTTLNVEFVGNLPQGVTPLYNEEKWDTIEITPQGTPTINDLGHGRRQLTQKYLIQSFDSGLYTLPPIYILADSDTIRTNTPVMKVIPADLDSTNVVWDDKGNPIGLTIKDYTDVETIESKFIDYIPDWAISYGWWILLTIIVVGGAIFVYMKWLRHGKIPLMPVKKPIPPYIKAMNELTKLHDMKLWQKGSEKEYYTRLTDILREYMQTRFGINAREMTSDQIRKALKNCEETNVHAHIVDPILSTADFVKFAKARPLADENEKAYSNAVQFVEETKPVEPEKEDSTENNTNGNTEQNVK